MYRIEVTKEYLGFASAHFITIKGSCERLHGHNYQTWFEIEGELNDDGYVCDFGELKRIAKKLCDSLDHRVLLATENPQIEIRTEGGSITATHGSRRYSFPIDDVVLLPIRNTTAELLATHLAECFAQQILLLPGYQLKSVGVWVAEGPGQRAHATQSLGESSFGT